MYPGLDFEDHSPRTVVIWVLFLFSISFCGITQFISYWVTSRYPSSPAAGILFCSFCPSCDLIPQQLSLVTEFLHVFYFTVIGNPSCKLLLDATSFAGNFCWMLIIFSLPCYLTFFWSPASLLLWKIIWIFNREYLLTVLCLCLYCIL